MEAIYVLSVLLVFGIGALIHVLRSDKTHTLAH